MADSDVLYPFRFGEADPSTVSWRARGVAAVGLQMGPCMVPSGVLMHSSEEEMSHSSLNLVGLGAGLQPGGQPVWVSRVEPGGESQEAKADVRWPAEGLRPRQQ